MILRALCNGARQIYHIITDLCVYVVLYVNLGEK